MRTKRMAVVERAMSAAQAGGLGDRAVDVAARLVYRMLDVEPLGDPCSDCRGEGAAGAVGVPSSKARILPYPCAGSGYEDIRHGFAGEVAAFYKHCTAAEHEEVLAR